MLELSAKKREIIGKGLNPLRKSGFLPAVVYGEGVETSSLSVPAKDFEKILKQAGETSLIALKVKGGEDVNVLIHDVARDPRTLAPLHADFHAVRMDKVIEANVALSFINESPAVKNEGGILVKVIHELEVKALPADLPNEIEVDISKLEKITDKLHVKDLSLPKGVTAVADAEEVVVLVEPPRSEEELAALESTPVAAEVAEVKTEQEVKAEAKAAEDAAKAAAEAEEKK